MVKRTIAAAGAGLALWLLTGPGHAEVFVYPKQGATQEEFQKDQFECHNWAQQQTGVNPSQPVAVAAAPPAREAPFTAPPGAPRWAPSAAPSAAMRGRARPSAPAWARRVDACARTTEPPAAAATQQAQANQQAGLQRYEQAYAACLGGRGYTVK